MRTRTRLGCTILLAVVTAATACSGSGNDGTQTAGTTGATGPSVPTTVAATTPAQSSGSGACALITQDEAAVALGMAVPAGTATTASIPVSDLGSIEAQYCSFGSEVLVARFDLGSAGASLFAQYRQSLSSESDYKTLNGVGDEAFFAKGQLAVRQGSSGLIIDVGQNTGSVAGEQEKEQALATAALGRI